MQDRERCLAEGMDSYLAKPVSKDALLALVARSVDDAPIGPSLPEPRQFSRDEITLDPAVFDELRALAETADGGFLATLVDRFRTDTEPMLGQLREAFEIGNAPAVSRLSHSIKGSCGQLGGRRLALSCDRLERKATAGRLADGQHDLTEIEVDFPGAEPRPDGATAGRPRGGSGTPVLDLTELAHFTSGQETGRVDLLAQAKPVLDPDVLERMTQLGRPRARICSDN